MPDLSREIGPTICCPHCGQQAWLLRKLVYHGELSELECAVCGQVAGIHIVYSSDERRTR